MDMNLSELRAKLDSIDNQFMDLLAKRIMIIEEIKQVKIEQSITTHQPDVASNKEAIFENYALENNLCTESYQEIYKCLHSLSLHQQNKG